VVEFVKKDIETNVEIKVLKSILKSENLLNKDSKIDMDIDVTRQDEVEIMKTIGKETSLDYNRLSQKDKNIVDSIAKEITIVDTNLIIDYASNVQAKLSDLSSMVMDNARTKKVGEIGNELANLVSEINAFNIGTIKNKTGMLKIFNNPKKVAEKLLAKYSKVEININRIVDTLEKNKILLLKEVTTFELLFEENLKFFKEISMYIIAGEQKLQELKEIELLKLEEIANNTKEQMDIQAVNDMNASINRFEKKIYDLKLSRIISIQMAPQIRMLQSVDSELEDKIESSIINTISLWKTQIAFALGIRNSKLAYQAEKRVTNTANEMLIKKSALLKQEAIDMTKESKRAIIDIEAIKTINSNILSTVEEVIKIQAEGKVKRLEATKELEATEQSLKNEWNKN